MNSVSSHLKRHPKARSTTLAYLTARDETLARLRAEIEEARAPKTLFQWVRHYHRKVMELAGGRT